MTRWIAHELKQAWRLVAATWFLLFAVALGSFHVACAFSQHQKVLAVERALEAGSSALDVAVDATIESCRQKNLPSEAERETCVAKISAVNDASTVALELGVAALRAYWAAEAAGDDAAADKALAGLRAAIDSLPPEYFAGLRALGEKVR